LIAFQVIIQTEIFSLHINLPFLHFNIEYVHIIIDSSTNQICSLHIFTCLFWFKFRRDSLFTIVKAASRSTKHWLGTEMISLPSLFCKQIVIIIIQLTFYLFIFPLTSNTFFYNIISHIKKSDIKVCCKPKKKAKIKYTKKKY
jgi:hypothetical protein